MNGASAPLVISSLQNILEQLWDVRADFSASDFLIKSARLEGIESANPNLPEQLFVRRVGDDVEIALYVREDILTKLSQAWVPDAPIPAEIFEDYCIALEGVSHLLMVVHRGSADSEVSALELEIQAEVDKWWSVLNTVKDETGLDIASRHALQSVFSSYQLRDGLSAGEHERYHVAHRVAKRFCQRLASGCRRADGLSKLNRSGRRFFRASLNRKFHFAHGYAH